MVTPWVECKNRAADNSAARNLLWRENAYEKISHLGCKTENVKSDQCQQKICGGFGNRLPNLFQVLCVLSKRGAGMELNKNYAALMLIEILYERGLVNRETLQAAREKTEEDRCLPLAA